MTLLGSHDFSPRLSLSYELPFGLTITGSANRYYGRSFLGCGDEASYPFADGSKVEEGFEEPFRAVKCHLYRQELAVFSLYPVIQFHLMQDVSEQADKKSNVAPIAVNS